jgi:ricin-type beta-trefoil lectin protein
MKIDIRFGVVLTLLLSAIPTTPALAQYRARPPSTENHGFLRCWRCFLPEQPPLSGRVQLCLQPESEGPIDGVKIVQRPCDFSNLYQKWWFTPAAGFNYQQPGIYRIVNSGSGKCLDNRDGRGETVQQSTCNSTSNTMQWKLVAVGKVETDVAQFINMRSRNKCLDRGGVIQSTRPPPTRPPAFSSPIVQKFCARANTIVGPAVAQVFGWGAIAHRPYCGVELCKCAQEAQEPPEPC